MINRKICIVTGSRAEYGLLYWLLKEINNSKELDLQLIVTGMHLSAYFGNTYKEIKKDFKIDKKINISLSSDTSIGISNSMGIALTKFTSTYKKLKPEIIVVLGDRYEILSAATAAMISQIPIAHIHGGEKTEGSWDECIRHCITKMSHLHFVATEQYKKRVIQLGESPKKIYHVGGMGIENIKKITLLNKSEFEEAIGFKLNKKNILVTFHPVTLENNTSKEQFQQLLHTIDELEDTNIIFTKTNSDINGKVINKMIDQYTNLNSQKAISFKSLGQSRYLSALKHVDAIVGNSSSGLIEAPSFKIGTINIGDRQRGRIKSESVIDCLPKKKDIKISFEKLYSINFQKILKTTKNPYDNGSPSKKIVTILKNVNLQSILKKRFYDVNYKI